MKITKPDFRKILDVAEVVIKTLKTVAEETTKLKPNEKKEK